MLPVGHPHHDLLLHVLHHVLPRLGVVRGRGRNEVAEVARLYGRRHAPGLDLLKAEVNILQEILGKLVI